MKILKFLSLFLIPICAIAQVHNVDSLKKVVAGSKPDAAKINALRSLSDYYIVSNTDSGVKYAELLRTVSIKAHNKAGEGYALGDIAGGYQNRGNSARALIISLKALQIFKDIKDSADLANEYIALSQLYGSEGNKTLSFEYIKQGWLVASKIKDYNNMFLAAENLGGMYAAANKLDSALYYAQRELKIQEQNPGNLNMPRSSALTSLANVYFGLHQYQRAGALIKEAFTLALRRHDPQLLRIELFYGYLFLQMHKPDSALTYAMKVSGQLQKKPELTLSVRLYSVLAGIYEQKKQFELAYKYKNAFIAAHDSLHNAAQSRQFENMAFNERQREADLKNAAAAYQNKLKLYAVIIALALVMIILVVIWRNYRKQQSANILLETQKQQIQDTLQDLKATQTQLIQSEKMASLGELTAGIAHEIQNPLNFVNNFSEVNTEMLQELKAESKKPKAERDEQLEIDLINDLIGNEEKINHHGKRADSIVKGMLQHSKASSGKKESTDINALADEYMRLSYHGLRAKDKSFNAELITHFDKNLSKINVVQQDMGRVLLNLYNNAFYAVHQKQKTAGADYKPEVTVTTLSENEKIIIKVKDNGCGIPDAIKEKIMQPFFTTKPTGEGTGLGLSLSYDIVIKGHNGKIEVSSKEGEGSEFIIQLPNQRS
jgi:two-component system NtrC family sensor kinase